MDGNRLPNAVAVIRVLMGAFFGWEAISQAVDGWLRGDGLSQKLTTALAENDVPGAYRWFLENVVLEADGVFTALVVFGEAAVAAGLVLGLFTRLSALVAISMNANFTLMNGIVTTGGIIDLAFIAGEMFLLAFAARQTWALDGLLGRMGLRHVLMSGPIKRPPEAVPAA